MRDIPLATIGQRIRDRRTSRGWNQEQLAVHAGLTGRTVRAIENGEGFQYSTLRQLAEALDVSVVDLVKPERVA